MNLAILFGGNSLEHEISIVTAFSIKKKLYPLEVTMLYVDYDNDLYDVTKNKLDDFKKNKKFKKTRFANNGIKGKRIDCVILACHGENCEDGVFAGTLRFYNINFVGSDILASSIAMDKWLTYLLLNGNDIDVVPTISYSFDDYLKQKEIPWFPCIVKPNYGGSSIGIFTCNNYDDFIKKYRLTSNKYTNYVIQPYYKDVLEYNMAFCNSGSSKLEKINKKNKFFSFEEKYIESFDSAHKEINEDDSLFKKIGMDVYRLLKCSGIIRIDFFKIDDKIYVNEINPIPGSLGLYLFDDAKRVLVEEINLATNKNKVKYHNSGYLIKSDIQK